MEPRNAEQLVIKMRLIVGRWHDSARVGNAGAAGNTLEDLLGVEENNLHLPDFGDIELKTQKFEGENSLLTLFHKEPLPRASIPKLLVAMGWRHSDAGDKYPANEMSFRSTTYGHRYTSRGLRLQTDAKRITLIYDPLQVERAAKDKSEEFATYGDWADDIAARKQPNYRDVLPVYYEIEGLAKDFEVKLDHTLLALYKTRTYEGKKQFWYEEAYLMKDVKPEKIVPLIEEGSMAVDFDARTGHNHGTKFRVVRSELWRLFTDFRLIE